MSIDPSQVQSVSIRSVMPPKSERTEFDYRREVRAKLGKMPSMAELAEREVRAAKRNWERTGPKNTSASFAMGTYARRLAWATILARISPVTAPEAAIALDVPNKSVSGRLQALEDGGFAKRIGVKPLTWEVKV